VRYPVKLLVTTEKQCINDATGKREMHKISLTQCGKLFFHNHTTLVIRRLSNLMAVGGGSEACFCGRFLGAWRAGNMMEMPEGISRERLGGHLNGRLQRKLALRRLLLDLPDSSSFEIEDEYNSASHSYDSSCAETVFLARHAAQELRRRGYKARRSREEVFIVFPNPEDAKKDDKHTLARFHKTGHGYVQMRGGEPFGASIVNFSKTSEWTMRWVADALERKIIHHMIDRANKRNKMATVDLVRARSDVLYELSGKDSDLVSVTFQGEGPDAGDDKDAKASSISVRISMPYMTCQAAYRVVEEFNKIRDRIIRLQSASDIQIRRRGRFPPKPRGGIGNIKKPGNK
jgi:hypothetical protein